KGVNFTDLRDAGDPVEMAGVYDAEGADELTFLDITASSSGRETTYDVVRRTAEQVFIPLTVGGGVRTVADVDALLRAGADKVGVNTAAVARPEFLREAAHRFGSQCIVLSIDARRAHGGTGIDAVEWAVTAQHLGAGEILLNSMDADGSRTGYDLELIRAVRAKVTVPLIASGVVAGQVDPGGPLPARGEQGQLDRVADHGHGQLALLRDHGRVAAGPAQHHPVRRPPQRRPRAELDRPPDRVGQRRRHRSRSPALLGPAHVLVVDDELEQVHQLLGPGQAHRRPLRRAGPHRRDDLAVR